MSITEQVKKYAQEATGISPAGFVVEVLRPKKGIEYHADLDTLEDAEAFIKRMEKKKPKWRMSILAMFRWPLDMGVLVHEAVDEDDSEILDARHMAFEELLPYIRGACSVYGWKIAEGALIPPKEHESHKWAAHWIKVEDKEIRKEAFKIPHWLPRVVEQQREKMLKKHNAKLPKVPICDSIRFALKNGWKLDSDQHLVQPGMSFPNRLTWVPVNWEGEKETDKVRLIYVPVNLEEILDEQFVNMQKKKTTQVKEAATCSDDE